MKQFKFLPLLIILSLLLVGCSKLTQIKNRIAPPPATPTPTQVHSKLISPTDDSLPTLENEANQIEIVAPDISSLGL